MPSVAETPRAQPLFRAAALGTRLLRHLMLATRARRARKVASHATYGP